MESAVADRRPRGRPRGVASKPYLKRVPKVVGIRLPPARSDELSPNERGRVTTYLDADSLLRLDLQQKAKLGCMSSQQVLYERYKLTVYCVASLQMIPAAFTAVPEPTRHVVYVLKPLFDF